MEKTKYDTRTEGSGEDGSAGYQKVFLRNQVAHEPL